MERRLTGQVAVVTGGASGIGRGVALELAKHGADVCIIDVIPLEEAAETLSQMRLYDVRSMYASTDVRDREGIQRVCRDVEQQMGGATIVVSAAVTSQRHELLHTPFDELRLAVEVGIYGTFHVFQAFAGEMLRLGIRGSIIQMTSPWASLPYGGGIDDRVTKSAQEHMARSLATELMRHGIRVNLVEPGWVDTPGERRWYSENDLLEAGRKLPLGRLCTPEDVGRAVVYLCTEPYVTGAHLTVDGGLSLTYFEASGGAGTRGGS